MRLPKSAHASRPWRIHEIAHDFRVEDVWSLPTPGGPDDFARLVAMAVELDPAGSTSVAVRNLFAARSKLGEILRWDHADAGVGARVPSLRERLPADLRAGARGPQFTVVPFMPLYLTADEFAAESANQTMHGVIHLGWVRDPTGEYRGEMAIYVKPNGLLGEAYMAAIRPFRYLIVYPTLMRAFAREWRARALEPSRAG